MEPSTLRPPSTWPLWHLAGFLVAAWLVSPASAQNPREDRWLFIPTGGTGTIQRHPLKSGTGGELMLKFSFEGRPHRMEGQTRSAREELWWAFPRAEEEDPDQGVETRVLQTLQEAALEAWQNATSVPPLASPPVESEIASDPPLVPSPVASEVASIPLDLDNPLNPPPASQTPTSSASVLVPPGQ